MQQETREYMTPQGTEASARKQEVGTCARAADKEPIAEQGIDRTPESAQLSNRTFQLLYLGLEFFEA
jgi:hypothetical protein